MSKTRIYELAKELGVENKVIIAKASEIGVAGRLSHSSSLDADEADQIRRAMIRSAVGQESEVVRTMVDKVTGEAEAIVERRKGNVIRRRKQSSTDAGDGDVASADSADIGLSPLPPSSSEGAVSELGMAAGSAAASEQHAVQQQGSLQEALQAREQRSPAHSEEHSSTNGHPAAVTSDRSKRVVAEEEPAESTGTAEMPVSESIEAQGAAETLPEGTPRDEEVAPEEEVKKSIGPRVLGKIELPQQRRPAASTAAEPATATRPSPGGRHEGKPAQEEEGEEDGRGRRSAAKRKGRKREISRVDLVDYEGRDARRGPRPRSRHKEEDSEHKHQQTEITKPKASKRVVKMSESITVGELARQMSVKAGEIIAKLMELGVLATINQSLDKDITTIVAEEFEYQVESTDFDETDILVDSSPEEEGNLLPRPPVVTVMGHVDHGKTSLLDAIREASVAQKEHGGITQHIGAYRVELPDKRTIAFIDTPGHAAFTSMRARGAQVTDIVVLVVAADDGVMPQTVEAINHAKAASVGLIVAVNKMDKQGANVDRIKQQLSEHGVTPEEWGGDTMFVPVSALKKQGLKELLEAILLVAEIRELKANPAKRARGTIIESRQDKGRGTVATVLVQNGTLRIGEMFVCGAGYGRVRSMVDYDGAKIDEAGPSTPVEITGFSEIPDAGDDFIVVESEASAKQVASERAAKILAREQSAAAGPISLEEFARRANNLAALELNVIVKTDVHGSLEALRDALEQLSTQKVRVKVIHSGVGGINESDVQLAIASKAIIVGFGVRSEARASEVAENAGVEIRFYRVIYELLDDIKSAMAGLLAPIREEVRLGRVEVRDTFNIPKMGTVAGCYVLEGTIKRGSFVRLLRDSTQVFEGKMSSLKRFKDDVREVQGGFECGIMLDSYNDVKVGDIMEVFEFKETAASLE